MGWISVTMAAAAALVLTVSTSVASAQESGLVPTVLWSSCRDAGFPTLDELAKRAKPLLWFSRDEPLLGHEGPLPRQWPRLGESAPIPIDLAYYRTTAIKASVSDGALVRAFQAALERRGIEKDLISTSRADPEALALVRLEPELLFRLSQITIRYLFYYPNELGTESHRHDLESVEMKLVVENADANGVPTAGSACRQIRVSVVYAAAHGLGLYTNVLDLDEVFKDRIADEAAINEAKAALNEGRPGTLPVESVIDEGQLHVPRGSDPFWPIVILVEEGKHASAPDRNGDGVFTPSYDVNRNTADAWGVRDTMRTRHLSPVFRADTFKRRVPEIMVVDRKVVPVVDAAGTHAQLRHYIRKDYLVQRATSDVDVCGSQEHTEAQRREHMEDYAATLKAQDGEGNPKGLLRGKGFCDDINVLSARNGMDTLRRLGVGGEHNGYTHFWERFSGSLRLDGGFGWTGTIPIGFRVPGVGGWLVGRLSGPWPTRDARKSVDVLYMPSSARFADWYLGAGIDRGVYMTTVLAEDGSPLRDDSGVVVKRVAEEGTRRALEIGMKFRFPVPAWGTFFGGRVGIRANGTGPIRNPRLVVEVGAGIW